ncbi:DegT/DnrJ/EryC1/StrS family aminotransferase [Verrucomicrobium spinosum]|uniref:DegT/DnrJ/EryC1/StrS family aminotransferase n=1 Tax=Verrucomicrobium spinosum TaxID=2736 RepID=UPI000174589D|nr:DegT/DnrJ/EryC1/StrS family aminotransferase [Verrucomicrobium spinosum]
MAVPLLDVNAQNHPLESEFTNAFHRIFHTGHFIMGQEVTSFEQEIAALVKSKHALGISSGTDAILLALMALDIGPGDEVLCPAFTFFATAGCVARTGATPVFVDVCPTCFNLDLRDARKKVTARTKAIVPVHLFGQSADMDGVLELAREKGLRVIEDAAQAIGAGYHGRSVGTMGDFGCYSFFPSKNLGGLGDGGLLVTEDDELAKKAISLRNHGMSPKYYHSHIGGNFRLDALQAAFLRVKLPHYAGYTANRRANAAFYTERLSALPGVGQASLDACAGLSPTPAQQEPAARITLPQALPGHDHIWNQYTLRIAGAGQRDALRDHLAARQIGCEIYYPLTMDQQACFASLPASSKVGCEVSHVLASEVLSIPIYPELTVEQKEEVVAAIAHFLATQSVA